MVKVRWGCWLGQAALVAAVVGVWACERLYEPHLAARWRVASATGEHGVRPTASLHGSYPLAKPETSLDAQGRMHLLTCDAEPGDRSGAFRIRGFGVQVVDAKAGIVSTVSLPLQTLGGVGFPAGLSVSDSGRRWWLYLRGAQGHLITFGAAGRAEQHWSSEDRALTDLRCLQALGETDCIVSADRHVSRYRLGVNTPLPVPAGGYRPALVTRSGLLCQVSTLGLPTPGCAWIQPDGSVQRQDWPQLERGQSLNAFAAQEPWVYAYAASTASRPSVSDVVYRVGRAGPPQRLLGAADPPPGTASFRLERLVAADARGTVWYCGHATAADGGAEWVLAYASRVPRWRTWSRARRGRPGRAPTSPATPPR